MSEIEPYQFPVHGISAEQFTNLQKIDIIEYALKQLPTEYTSDYPLKHHFCNGVYIREILMPKGSLLTSKIHKTHHFAIIVSGDISVMTNDKIIRYQGFQIFETSPGTKRALYAHEDTIWITVHPTAKTDLADIEPDIVESSDLSWISDAMGKIGQ
jgi:hypothetical protein